MSRNPTPAERELIDLAMKAYLSALRLDPPGTVLDKLQDAYWQGLGMEPDYAPAEGEPPF